MGRPKGSKNKTATAPPTQTVAASRCKKCDSTEAASLGGVKTQEYAGTHDGKPFTHVVRRRVICLSCEQVRIDVTHENRAKQK